jgi:hypothetical protein
MPSNPPMPTFSTRLPYRSFAAPPERGVGVADLERFDRGVGPRDQRGQLDVATPVRVGTTRDVVAPGGATPRALLPLGRSRHSFACYESILPLFRRFAEDDVVEPDGAGTFFTWTLAMNHRLARVAVEGVGACGEGRFRADTQ